MEVNVAFIEKVGNDENFILTTSFPFYPNYNQKDFIFLEVVNRKDSEKSIKTTQFFIDRVVHSVREIQYSNNHKSQENPLGFHSQVGIEVYVTRCD
jgi:hypothetical protein